MSENFDAPGEWVPPRAPQVLWSIAWIVVVLIAAVVSFALGASRGARDAVQDVLARPPSNRPRFDMNRESEVLSTMADDIFWFVPVARNGPGRSGQLYVGTKHRSLVMYGPHKLTLEKERDFSQFTGEFEQRLHRHVDAVVGKNYEAHVKSFDPVRGKEFQQFPLGFREDGYTWTSTEKLGYSHPECATLEATYERRVGRGTVLVHISFEPNYAILTLIENPP